jgi:hypothetical protein
MQGGQNYWFPQLIVVLPFSCSCLVSSSPSEVGQFKFACCPQVQEMSSVVHELPCFGDGFSLCLFPGVSAQGVYFFAPSPFSGVGSVFHQPPLLSVCYDGLLFVFQFCRAIWLWVLLTGSGDEFCDPLPALLWGVAYHLLAFHLSSFPVFVYW